MIDVGNLGFAALALRQRMVWAWPLFALLLIALLDLQFRVQFPAAGHRGGNLGIGAITWVSHWRSWLETCPLSVTRRLLTLVPAFWLHRKRTITG
jgi:hypothetical protein